MITRRGFAQLLGLSPVVAAPALVGCRREEPAAPKKPLTSWGHGGVIHVVRKMRPHGEMVAELLSCNSTDPRFCRTRDRPLPHTLIRSYGSALVGFRADRVHVWQEPQDFRELQWLMLDCTLRLGPLDPELFMSFPHETYRYWKNVYEASA